MTINSFYVAGPIFGKPYRNEELFRKVAAVVHRDFPHAGIVVPLDVKPLDHEGSCPGDYGHSDEPHKAACYLRACIPMMLACDAIVLLPGWRDSNGTRLEIMTATACGLEIYTYSRDLDCCVRISN